jgi:hypothetical protein
MFSTCAWLSLNPALCACAHFGFATATEIAASGTERRRSRFVNIFNTPQFTGNQVRTVALRWWGSSVEILSCAHHIFKGPPLAVRFAPKSIRGRTRYLHESRFFAIDFAAVHESAFGPSVWTGRALQAESDDLEKLVLRFCIRPMMEPWSSWPSWISARVRSHSRLGHEGQKGHLITNALARPFSPSPLFDSQTSAGNPLLLLGLA